MKSTKEDRERVRELSGLYVGMLDNDEIEILDRCIADNIAKRDYGHAGGMLGMAKVLLVPADKVED